MLQLYIVMSIVCCFCWNGSLQVVKHFVWNLNSLGALVLFLTTFNFMLLWNQRKFNIHRFKMNEQTKAFSFRYFEVPFLMKMANVLWKEIASLTGSMITELIKCENLSVKVILLFWSLYYVYMYIRIHNNMYLHIWYALYI